MRDDVAGPDGSALSEGLGLAPKRASLIVRLFAWVRGGRPVCLEDFTGETYFTIAELDAFGKLRAPVYWFFGVGDCVLLADGRVCGRSASSYVKRWVWA